MKKILAICFLLFNITYFYPSIVAESLEQFLVGSWIVYEDYSLLKQGVFLKEREIHFYSNGELDIRITFHDDAHKPIIKKGYWTVINNFLSISFDTIEYSGIQINRDLSDSFSPLMTLQINISPLNFNQLYFRKISSSKFIELKKNLSRLKHSIPFIQLQLLPKNPSLGQYVQLVWTLHNSPKPWYVDAENSNFLNSLLSSHLTYFSDIGVDDAMIAMNFVFPSHEDETIEFDIYFYDSLGRRMAIITTLDSNGKFTFFHK